MYSSTGLLRLGCSGTHLNMDFPSVTEGSVIAFELKDAE